MRNLKQKLGFTLVELMVVVAILGAMTVIGVPAIKEISSSSGKRNCSATLNSAQSAIQKAVDNKCVFEREVPLDENNGNLRLYIKNLDDFCCTESGEHFIITNENKVYCPHHNQYSGMVLPPINLSGGRVPTDNVGDDDSGDDGGGNATPPAHTHSYTTKVVSADCVNGGYTLYTCSDGECGFSYKGNTTEALGHTTTTTTTNATCTTDGKTETKCSVCGATTSTTIPATGHSYTSKVTTAATCATTGTKTYTCSGCGDSYTETISATGHSYTSTITKAACTTTGHTTHTCSACGDSYTETIPATGHSYTKTNDTTHTCTSCSLNENHISSSVVSYTYPLYSTSGSFTHYCAKCNSNYTESFSTNRQYCGLGDTFWGTGSTKHNMVPTVTAPTCTTDGYTTYKCNQTITYNYNQQTCIFEYKSDYVPATGHNFVDGVCSSCGATEGSSGNGDSGNQNCSHTFEEILDAGYRTDNDYHICSSCGLKAEHTKTTDYFNTGYLLCNVCGASGLTY